MLKTYAHPGAVVTLGRRGENMARQVVFDLSAWVAVYGAGTVQAIAQRAGDASPYPVSIEQTDTAAIWTVNSADTANVGDGKVELLYTVDDVVVKSEIWQTSVLDALTDDTTEPPESAAGWVERVLSAGAQAVDAAAAAEQAASRAENAVPAGSLEIGDGLKFFGGKLVVDTADNVEQDNTKPVTSAAVYTEIGNIEALLAAI